MHTRRELGRTIVRRSRELALEWHRQLQTELAVTEREVLPEVDPGGHAAGLVAWIGARVERQRGPRELTDLVTPLVRLRRREGVPLAGLLTEFRILSRILADTLIATIETAPDELSPGRAARLIADLQEAVGVVVEGVGEVWSAEEEVAAAHAASREIAEYSRMLSHELTTPLNAAGLAAQALLAFGDAGDRERREEMASRALASVRRASRLVEAVRALATAADRSDGSRREPLPLVIDRVLSQVSADARDAEVAVDSMDSGDLPDVTVDGRRVEMVLQNLVANAVKYADPSKPVRWVRLRAAVEAEALRVQVGDNGLGIPHDQQARIFDRFYRAHRKDGDGHGLGLAIVREAIEQLGGEIGCESAPGEGSTFCFSLPILPDPPDPSAS